MVDAHPVYGREAGFSTSHPNVPPLRYASVEMTLFNFEDLQEEQMQRKSATHDDAESGACPVMRDVAVS
ncbi:MAG: hypothetical protein WDN23_14985 [Edaphobacter sp.]